MDTASFTVSVAAFELSGPAQLVITTRYRFPLCVTVSGVIFKVEVVAPAIFV